MGIPVPPKSLDTALSHVFAGGRLVVATYTKCTVITQKNLDKWDAAGLPLLAEEGDGYRMRRGRKSEYLFPGTLKMID